MDTNEIVTLQVVILSIQLMIMIMVTLLRYRKVDVSELLSLDSPQETLGVMDLPPTIPVNAKWFRQFKNQLRNQTTIDTQYRNGLLTLYTNNGPVTYSVDGWILRRIRSIPFKDLFIFLEQEVGHVTNGVKIHKSNTRRTAEWFRKRKRISPKLSYTDSQDDD